MPASKPQLGYTNAARALMSERSAERDVAFFLPHIGKGSKVLDCGCGQGQITVGLAQRVAPTEVIGIDQDQPAIEVAKATAIEKSLQNLSFKSGNVYELPFEDELFDALLANNVFEHLVDREKALGEMERVLKPGGIIGVRSPDLESTLWWPESDAMSRISELMMRARNHNNGESNMGRQLPAMLFTGGFESVEATPSYENYGTPERAVLYSEFYGSILEEENYYSGTMIEQGWATRSELDSLVEQLKAWSTTTGAYIAHPLVGAVGWKSRQ